MTRELDLLEEKQKRHHMIVKQIDFQRSLLDNPPGTFLECLAMPGWTKFTERICNWTGRLLYQKRVIEKEIKDLNTQILHDEEEMMKDARSLLRY